MRALSRAYHNDPQVLSCDGGRIGFPKGRYLPTTVDAVRPIASITGTAGIAFTVELETPFPLNTIAVGSLIGIQGMATDFFNSRAWTVSSVTSQTTFSVLSGGATPGTTESDIGHALFHNSTIDGGRFVDPQRVLSHPSFRQREGEGIYTYPFNPDITKNFIFAPAKKVDGVVQKTISSNVLVQVPQVDEDTIITEIWLGGERQASTLTEMARVFHEYWTTPPDAGLTLGWEPLDIVTDRYNVAIVQVQIGGLDYDYKEVRQVIDDAGSGVGQGYLNRQLTLKLKLVKGTTPPRNSIVLEGL